MFVRTERDEIPFDGRDASKSSPDAARHCNQFESTSCLPRRIPNRQKLAHLKQLMGPSVESTEAYFTWELGACIMALDDASSAIGHDELVFVLGFQCLVYYRLETVMRKPDMYSWASSTLR